MKVKKRKEDNNRTTKNISYIRKKTYVTKA